MDSSNQDLSEARAVGRVQSVVRGAWCVVQFPQATTRGPMPSISQIKPASSHVLGKSRNCPSMTHPWQERANWKERTARWPFFIIKARLRQLRLLFPSTPNRGFVSRDVHVLRGCTVSRLDRNIVNLMDRSQSRGSCWHSALMQRFRLVGTARHALWPFCLGSAE